MSVGLKMLIFTLRETFRAANHDGAAVSLRPPAETVISPTQLSGPN